MVSMQAQLSSFEELAQSRRSLRRYTDTPISRDLIEDLLHIASWAPSAHNRQPWRFVVIDTESTKVKLARAMGARLQADLEADAVPEDVIQKDVERSFSRITGAAVLLCLCMTMEDMDTYPDAIRSENERIMAVQSTAMAGQNFLLAAHAAGLGACWMCAPLFCPDVVQVTLEIPKSWEPQGLITMGFPAQERERTREPLASRLVWR